MKKILEHPLVKLYLNGVLTRKQCVQCQFPWRDGICSCHKWGKQQEFIKEMGQRMIRDGWVE